MTQRKWIHAETEGERGAARKRSHLNFTLDTSKFQLISYNLNVVLAIRENSATNSLSSNSSQMEDLDMQIIASTKQIPS